MFKSLNFQNISCKKQNCQAVSCLFNHSLKSGDFLSKSTQTQSDEINVENGFIKKRKLSTLVTSTDARISNTMTTDNGDGLDTVSRIKTPKPKLTPKVPEIEISLNSKIPRKTRQKALLLLHTEISRIYQSLPDTLAYNHALEQELQIYLNSSPLTYSVLIRGCLSRLKGRSLAVDQDDVGLDGSYKPRVIVKMHLLN